MHTPMGSLGGRPIAGACLTLNTCTMRSVFVSGYLVECSGCMRLISSTATPVEDSVVCLIGGLVVWVWMGV